MTKNYYLNLKYSLRAFCVSLDTTLRWYIDAINETPTESVFAIVKTSTDAVEDETLPYTDDMINLNVFAKELANVESTVGTILQSLSNRNIQVKDYKDGTLTLLDTLGIKSVNVEDIGEMEGYYQKNISIYFERIGE